MSNLASITRLALVTAIACTGLAAQEGWEGTLKFGGGPTTGPAHTVMNNGLSFAPTLELSYKYSKTDSFVFGAGFRFFPGQVATASFIPAPPASTGYITTGTTPRATATYVAGGPYDARIRKPDGKGLELTGMYRHDYNHDLYFQGGLRLGLYKVNVRDTGSRITYGETATVGTGANLGKTNYGVTPTSIVTIMDDLDKKTTSFGVVGGLGYRISDVFSVEANVFTVRLGNPRGLTTTSVASEVTFGIRF